jgi:hypothetical protein
LTKAPVQISESALGAGGGCRARRGQGSALNGIALWLGPSGFDGLCLQVRVPYALGGWARGDASE